VVKQYLIESYAGAPFSSRRTTVGRTVCLGLRAVIFDDPDLADTLGLFARLIGCIFYSNLTDVGSGYSKNG
jgi:hypothetical protein